jgi:hypothetical protein
MSASPVGRTARLVSNHASTWLVVAVCLGALAIRLVFFGGLLGWDDMEYWEVARAYRNGDVIPRSMFSVRFGIVLPLAATQALFGATEVAASVVPLAYSLAELLLAWRLGVLYGGPGVGLVAAGLVAILPVAVMEATEVNADLPAAVWMAAALYAVVRGERSVGSPRGWLFTGGVALGIAYVTKDYALALLATLAVRVAVTRRRRAAYAWTAVGLVAVIAVQAVWFWALTGDPLFRYSPGLTAPHTVHVQTHDPSYRWMLTYLDMLLDPFNGSFGYFIGVFYAVVAATIWGFWRRDRALLDVSLWWATVLVVFSVTPLDWTFTRPLFHQYARKLEPLVVPFALALALWWARGLVSWPRLRLGLGLALAALAGAGIWATQADYRQPASVARWAAPLVDRERPDVYVVTDHVNAPLLRALLPARRDRIVTAPPAATRDADGSMLVLRDPLFLTSDLAHGRSVASIVAAPPQGWGRVGEFVRPHRRGLRSALLGRPLPPRPEPAELWRSRAEAS